ncbi:MAG: hypothetical protein GY904_04490 [Planctomycetaceae bacterium]|nr:hypothetical protein [Planctomycetaceae bacterium]
MTDPASEWGTHRMLQNPVIMLPLHWKYHLVYSELRSRLSPAAINGQYGLKYVTP